MEKIWNFFLQFFYPTCSLGHPKMSVWSFFEKCPNNFECVLSVHPKIWTTSPFFLQKSIIDAWLVDNKWKKSYSDQIQPIQQAQIGFFGFLDFCPIQEFCIRSYTDNMFNGIRSFPNFITRYPIEHYNWFQNTHTHIYFIQMLNPGQINFFTYYQLIMNFWPISANFLSQPINVT